MSDLFETIITTHHLPSKCGSNGEVKFCFKGKEKGVLQRKGRGVWVIGVEYAHGKSWGFLSLKKSMSKYIDTSCIRYYSVKLGSQQNLCTKE